ncbi:hypothetical protein GALL_547350 [mine drainage metagenome]|uniref:Uncharacterized protein n=1 Tax=mine drainage metagenome TaxID=410659 RepID=A0A1J5PEQ8_9ZZZZ
MSLVNQTLPANWLLPDLVTAFTTPPRAEYSGANPPVCTDTWSMKSVGMVLPWKPRR